MKKAGFVLAATLLLLTSLPSFAQQTDSQARHDRRTPTTRSFP